MTWLAPKLSSYLPDPTGAEPTHHFHAKHLLASEPRCFWRDSFAPGHFTGSIWVTNPTFTKTLLIMHPKFHTWFQPGGHADGEDNLFNVAMRELEEELGLTAAMVKNPITDNIFDIDIHNIPARKGEPEHLHYDVRFLAVIDDNQVIPGSTENITCQWFPLSEAEAMFPQGQGRWRMLQKTRALTPGMVA